MNSISFQVVITQDDNGNLHSCGLIDQDSFKEQRFLIAAGLKVLADCMTVGSSASVEIPFSGGLVGPIAVKEK